MHVTLALEAQELLGDQELLKLGSILEKNLQAPNNHIFKTCSCSLVQLFTFDQNSPGGRFRFLSYYLFYDSPHSVFDLRHLQKSFIRINHYSMGYNYNQTQKTTFISIHCMFATYLSLSLPPQLRSLSPIW